MQKTWKVVLAFAGIFVAGLVVGGLITLRFFANNPPPRMGSPEQFGPTLMRRFTSKLDLTEQQQEKIRPLIAKAGEELHQIRRTTWASSKAIIDRVEAEIAAELTPEQKTKFDQMLAEQRDRMKRITEERQRRQRDGRRPEDGPPPPPKP